MIPDVTLSASRCASLPSATPHAKSPKTQCVMSNVRNPTAKSCALTKHARLKIARNVWPSANLPIVSLIARYNNLFLFFLVYWEVTFYTSIFHFYFMVVFAWFLSYFYLKKKKVTKTNLRSNLPRTQLRLEMHQTRMPQTKVRISVREPWMQTHCGMLQMWGSLDSPWSRPAGVQGGWKRPKMLLLR